MKRRRSPCSIPVSPVIDCGVVVQHPTEKNCWLDAQGYWTEEFNRAAKFTTQDLARVALEDSQGV